MGIGGISVWQLVIILLIVVLLFGTKKLRNIGGDLGSAVKNFRGAMRDGEKEQNAEKMTEEQQKLADNKKPDDDASQAIDAKVTHKETQKS
ncbi:Sec-independent protein translocase subunit TatA [Candidatus Venteria ishoeyi]|uniref:Sec-independent protein translocase protein TatA n=1 Tax=Candidatus Venteria ishoeyi TaxID=1899563 RepID=A0A1H6FH60_9GAMM|nr:Sec-independent protein translocase subunit TatA [Candidatus Venteria ishoeyi]MDM8547911.1 Sec-independent protein translocase subunit TatA [Candidatus Venteria ishoeyi]SEH08771.1 Sec-independent protein translocase protein TatA [Candidatus Venteria ishoeyi]